MLKYTDKALQQFIVTDTSPSNERHRSVEAQRAFHGTAQAGNRPITVWDLVQTASHPFWRSVIEIQKDTLTLQDNMSIPCTAVTAVQKMAPSGSVRHVGLIANDIFDVIDAASQHVFHSLKIRVGDVFTNGTMNEMKESIHKELKTRTMLAITAAASGIAMPFAREPASILTSFYPTNDSFSIIYIYYNKRVTAWPHGKNRKEVEYAEAQEGVYFDEVQEAIQGIIDKRT